jgi:sugar lactone lactonase YvrE
LNVRPNDLAADSQGGTYFTVGCVYYAGPSGTIVAFDVLGPGILANCRDSAMLQTDSGDGLSVDTEGRLYVTSASGVQMLDVGSGADDAGGQPIREGPQQTAATIYKLQTITQGVKDRGK